MKSKNRCFWIKKLWFSWIKNLSHVIQSHVDSSKDRCKCTQDELEPIWGLTAQTTFEGQEEDATNTRAVHLWCDHPGDVSRQNENGHFVDRPRLHSSLTYDEEDDKADDEEGGATDGHSTSKVDERRKQQGGPEQEVQQRPWPATWDYCGSGELAFFVVHFLQGILSTLGRRSNALNRKINVTNKESTHGARCWADKPRVDDACSWLRGNQGHVASFS